ENMKRTYKLMLTAACLAGLLYSAFAADVRKNKPKTKDVEQVLEAIGGEHFPEGMKISPVGPVETETTYYHVFYGTRKKGGYHLIFFDNTPTYLGYYLISYEPTGYGEGEIYLYRTSDSTTTVPIGDDGPPEKILTDESGMKAKFVPAPVVEEPEEEAADATTALAPPKKKKKPEYREWNIAKDGKLINVPSAIFVEMKDGNVSIMNAKNGLIATVPIGSLSPEDKQYLKELLQ
ncbi:MAG TPA: hypothetical protein VLL07_02240, partial [Pontiella sp.]|nr:hypothetical protein [Pontiella sp.]